MSLLSFQLASFMLLIWQLIADQVEVSQKIMTSNAGISLLMMLINSTYLIKGVLKVFFCSHCGVVVIVTGIRLKCLEFKISRSTTCIF